MNLWYLIWDWILFEEEKYEIRQSSIKISKDNYPECYELLKEISNDLGINPPECYIQDSEVKNAFSLGFNKPYVVLYRKLYNLLSKDMLRAVLAHELTHLKNKDWIILIIDNKTSNFFTRIFGWLFDKLRKTDYRIAEVKADIEALKQTNLETMKRLCLLFLGETDVSKVNFDKIVEDQYKNEKQKYFEIFWDHPTPIHRYLMLKKADEIIKSGEKEIYVGSKKKHLFKIFLWIIILIIAIWIPFDFFILDIIAFLSLVYNIKSYFSFKRKNKISL